MTSLPLNRRQYLELSLLGPGVLPPAAGSRLSVQANSGVNVSGAREASNNFLLDGVDNNDLFINRMVVNPSVDAIREFRIHSANYDAEYGRSGGAQVNVVTKSGTNRFHGSLYEFLRNSRLDARNFFDPVDDKIPQFQRNQFGGTLGGPLVKARTFFFFNFEGVRTRRAESRLANVPTLLEKGGDFSESGVTILDPFTGLPFSGNRIPEDRIHRSAAIWPRSTPTRTAVWREGISWPHRWAGSAALSSTFAWIMSSAPGTISFPVTAQSTALTLTPSHQRRERAGLRD